MRIACAGSVLLALGAISKGNSFSIVSSTPRTNVRLESTTEGQSETFTQDSSDTNAPSASPFFVVSGPPDSNSQAPQTSIGSPQETYSYFRSPTLFSDATGSAVQNGSRQENEVRPVPMFPIELQMDRIEGVGTRRTYRIPPWAERAQYVLTTNGRPLKAKVELWVGPGRTTHYLDIDVENGQHTPVRAMLKFKKGTEVITVKTSDSGELPVTASVFVPSPERSEEIGAFTDRVWKESEKTKIQGGIIDSGGKLKGAVRYFNIPAEVDAVQVLFWSKNTGKKSLKATIEVLQGPNNAKQSYELQCGGGSQPYHAIFETPGGSSVIRIINKKSMEDGLFECAVVPMSLS